jgi:type I restriction enzyme S subunit
MNFPRHELYRESKVDWLGDIPTHWRVMPIKHIGWLKGGSGFPPDYQGVETDEIPFHKVNAISQANADATLGRSTNTISRDVAKKLGAYVFPPSSIVFAKVGAALLLGRIRLIDRESCIDNNMMGLVVRQREFEVRFLMYAMQIVRFDLLANPGTVPSLNERQIGDFKLAIPPLAEQRCIAQLLDVETGKIDELIAAQRHLMDLLKEKRQAVVCAAVTKGLDPNVTMKCSGDEWLGRVPAHWTVTRIANVFREVSDAGTEDLPILSVSIHRGVSDEEIDEEDLERKVTRSDDRSKYKRVEPGDLVYNMMRAWQGGFGSVAVHGMVSPAYVVARPKSPVATEFVEHLLRTTQAIEQMRRYSRGVTDFRLRLYWAEFKNLQVALPPSEEASEICASIERMSQEFDDLSKACEEAIAILQARRVSLISAAVTGKIDVSVAERAA